MATQRKIKNDLSGKNFGRLHVLRRSKICAGSKPRVLWVCQCDCGVIKDIRGDALTGGKTESCGCLSRERSTTHGMRNTIVYRKWVGMRQRCNDKNCPQYPRYGGRGIKIDSRWDKFENFLEDMGLPPTGTHQPDRIDNDGNYAPGNVRWATPKTNANNRGDNIIIEHNGKSQSMALWAAEYGIKYSTFQNRLSSGWSMDKALNQPIDAGKAAGGRYKR